MVLFIFCVLQKYDTSLLGTSFKPVLYDGYNYLVTESIIPEYFCFVDFLSM